MILLHYQLINKNVVKLQQTIVQHIFYKKLTRNFRVISISQAGSMLDDKVLRFDLLILKKFLLNY